MPCKVTYHSFWELGLWAIILSPLPVHYETLEACPVLLLLILAPPTPKSNTGTSSSGQVLIDQV